jgi:hypothetical protein
VLSSHNLAISQLYDVHFDMWPGLGSCKGVELLSFGATITGLDAADGEVGFYEGLLALPAALSASTVYVVSSSASDTGTYRLQGIDANGDYQDVTVTATGTTPVAASGTWNHVQSCNAVSADNVGTVYVSTDAGAIPTTTGDQIQTVMLPGKNYAINPVLECPNNWIILINSFSFSADTNQVCVVQIDCNRQGRYIENFKFFAADFEYFQEFHAPIKLWPGDKMRIKVELSAGVGADLTFGMNGTVLRNDLADMAPVFSAKHFFDKSGG